MGIVAIDQNAFWCISKANIAVKIGASLKAK